MGLISRVSSRTYREKMPQVWSKIGSEPWTEWNIKDLPNSSHLQKLGYKYADCTQTSDTWRYAKTKSFPLDTEFTDAMNVTWRGRLNGERDDIKMIAPIERQQYFYGDEKDRVGVDAKVRVASYHFHYQEKSIWHSHGIRLHTRGYITDSDGSTSNLGYWKEAIEVAQGIANVGKTIASTGTDIAGIYNNCKAGK